MSAFSKCSICLIEIMSGLKFKTLDLEMPVTHKENVRVYVLSSP